MRATCSVDELPKLKAYPWERVFPHGTPQRAMDLARNLLCYDPSQRLTASQALQHPFLQDAECLLQGRTVPTAPDAAKEFQAQLVGVLTSTSPPAMAPCLACFLRSNRRLRHAADDPPPSRGSRVRGGCAPQGCEQAAPKPSRSCSGCSLPRWVGVVAEEANANGQAERQRVVERRWRSPRCSRSSSREGSRGGRRAERRRHARGGDTTCSARRATSSAGTREPICFRVHGGRCLVRRAGGAWQRSGCATVGRASGPSAARGRCWNCLTRRRAAIDV